MMFRSLLLAAALASGFVFSACAAAQGYIDPTAPDAIVTYGGPDPLVIETAEGERHAFTVEVADTPDSRQRGLMHREAMDADAGMLFDFGREQIVSIWMENTILPLDILYIRADGVIAKVVVGAVPFSRRQLISDVPVVSVLELNAGRAAALGIDPGDRVLHPLFGTSPEAPAVDTAPEAEAEAEADAEAGSEAGAATEPAAEPVQPVEG